MEQAIVARQRTGWNSAEEALLHEAVDRCRAAGEPLKAAFDEAAAQTGRRPNSVRNHYYSSSKSTGTAPAFLPFSEEESLALLKSQPALVERVRQELQADGRQIFDPYAPSPTGPGRPRKTAVERDTDALIRTLCESLSELLRRAERKE